MLGFARELKSIRSALLNLVELDPGTRQIGPISGYISTHKVHASRFQLTMPRSKLTIKLRNIPKFLRGKGSQIPGKRGNVTLIHPMSYKPQFSIDEVLQCLVDKYQITYSIIWGRRCGQTLFSGIRLL